MLGKVENIGHPDGVKSADGESAALNFFERLDSMRREGGMSVYIPEDLECLMEGDKKRYGWQVHTDKERSVVEVSSQFSADSERKEKNTENEDRKTKENDDCLEKESRA